MNTNNSGTTIEFDGILAPNGVDRYSRQFKAKLYSSARKAMQTYGKEYKQKIQIDAEQKLTVKRKAVVKSFSYKIYFQRTDKVPTLHFYSRVPWMGIQDKGGNIQKTVFIPLSKKRIGYKTMKDIIQKLHAGHNLFFEKRGRTTIAWSKNTQQFQKLLAPFRATTRARNGSVVRRDQRVNVAVVTKNTRLRKKLKFTELVIECIPNVVNEIQRLVYI